MTKRKRVEWGRVAEKLATAMPRACLHPSVLEWEQRSSGRAGWGVAFSGGADSVALLLLLWAHWPERRARLKVLHFNHRLRGRACHADEKFCRKVCAALGVKLVCGAW